MRADATEHDRIDKFQMAGVEAKRKMNFSSVAHRPVAAVAEMIFYVAALRPQLWIGVGEFAENFTRVLSDDVGQHIEPAAMSHADDDVFHALMAGLFDGKVGAMAKAFRSLRVKMFFAPRNFVRRNSSKNRRVREPRENAELFVAGKFQAILRTFHAALKPLPPFQIINMQELHRR